MKETRVNVYFIPPYYPLYAPIIRYFSILKQLVLSYKGSYSVNLKIFNEKKLIEQWTQEIQKNDIKSIWNHYFNKIIKLCKYLK